MASFAAGVGPLVGLHATWIIGMISAVFGARPGQVWRIVRVFVRVEFERSAASCVVNAVRAIG